MSVSSSIVNCAICLNPNLLDQEVISHPGEGSKHPFHLQCAKDFFISGSDQVCPVCRENVDFSIALSEKEDQQRGNNLLDRHVEQFTGSSLEELAQSLENRGYERREKKTKYGRKISFVQKPQKNNSCVKKTLLVSGITVVLAIAKIYLF